MWAGSRCRRATSVSRSTTDRWQWSTIRPNSTAAQRKVIAMNRSGRMFWTTGTRNRMRQGTQYELIWGAAVRLRAIHITPTVPNSHSFRSRRHTRSPDRHHQDEAESEVLALVEPVSLVATEPLGLHRLGRGRVQPDQGVQADPVVAGLHRRPDQPGQMGGAGQREPGGVGEEGHRHQAGGAQRLQCVVGPAPQFRRTAKGGVPGDQRDPDHPDDHHDGQDLGPDEELDDQQQTEDHPGGDRPPALAEQELVEAGHHQRRDRPGARPSDGRRRDSR